MPHSDDERMDQVTRDLPHGESVLGKVKLLQEIWQKREELRSNKAALSQSILGTIEELEDAEKTLNRSLKNVSKELRFEEIEKAKESGGITEQDASSIRKIKTLLEREAELLKRRENQQTRDDLER